MRKIVLVALLCYCLVLTEDVCDKDLLHCYGSCLSLWGNDECETPDSNSTDGKCTGCLNWDNNDVDVCSWNCSKFGEFCEYCTNDACTRCLTQEDFDDETTNCSIPQNCSAIKGDALEDPYVEFFCANPSLLNPALHCVVDIEDDTKCIDYKEYTCDLFTAIKGPNHCHKCQGNWDSVNKICYDCMNPSTIPNKDICENKCTNYWNSTESKCHTCYEDVNTKGLCEHCSLHWLETVDNGSCHDCSDVRTVDDEEYCDDCDEIWTKDDEGKDSCHLCEDALTLHNKTFCEDVGCEYYWIAGEQGNEGTCHDCMQMDVFNNKGFCDYCHDNISSMILWVGDEATGSCHTCDDALEVDDEDLCEVCNFYWIDGEAGANGTCHDCSDVKTTKHMGYCESCTGWHWVVDDEGNGSCHTCDDALDLDIQTFCTTCNFYWLPAIFAGATAEEGTCHDCSDVKNVDDEDYCDWCELHKTDENYHWVVEDEESGSCHDCKDPMSVYDETLCETKCGLYWDEVGKACHDCTDVSHITIPDQCHWCNHFKSVDANWATDKCEKCTAIDEHAVTCTNDTIDTCATGFKVSGDKKSCYVPMAGCLEAVGETMCFLCKNGMKPSQMGTSNCHICPYCGDGKLDDGEECDGAANCGTDCKCIDPYMKGTGNACKPKCNARCAQDCTEPYKCTNCTSPYTGEKCDSCIAGYYDSTPPVNSSSSDSGAAEDVSEHIPTCTKCMEHCIECSVAATCTKCDPAYNLAEGKCVAKPASSTGASMLSFFYFLIFFWFM